MVCPSLFYNVLLAMNLSKFSVLSLMEQMHTVIIFSSYIANWE